MCFGKVSFCSRNPVRVNRHCKDAIIDQIWAERKNDPRKAAIKFSQIIDLEASLISPIGFGCDVSSSGKLILKFTEFNRADKYQRNKLYRLRYNPNDYEKHPNRLPFTVIKGDNDLYILVNTGHDYKSYTQLGNGATGRVRTAYSVRTGMFMAVKKGVIEDSDDNTLFNEDGILTLISTGRHELVLSQKKRGQDVLYLFSELHGENLREIKDELSDASKLLVLKHICQDLVKLHEEEMLHRDIKLENIFMKLNSSDQAVLGDFGLTAALSSFSKDKIELLGTYEYLSPEIIFEFKYTKASDIWALGTVLLELMFDNSLLFKRFQERHDCSVHKQCISKVIRECIDDTLGKYDSKKLELYDSIAGQHVSINNFVGVSDAEMEARIDSYVERQQVLENRLKRNKWRCFSTSSIYLKKHPKLISLLKKCFKNNPEDRCSLKEFNEVVTDVLAEGVYPRRNRIVPFSISELNI